ncbi:MAG: hypothetical protein HY811_01575 [Planctomycetes bacterium]|nr:hypothetical protein [Planctomycetota bacterium]
MAELSLRPGTNLKTQVGTRLWGRVKLSNFMELPEKDFRKLIMETELHPFFKKLFVPDNPREKIISYQRFPQTDLADRYCQLNEEITVSRGAADISPLLEKKKELIPEIKKIGLDNFKRYFVTPDENLSKQDIAEACNIPLSQVKAIRELMDELYLLDLAHPMAASAPVPAAAPGVKIAAIEHDDAPQAGQTAFKIGYLSTHYARGRYNVNYKRLFQLKSQNKFSSTDFREIEKLLKQIELINTRQTILYQVVKKIVNDQTEYFRTRDENALKPLTQQMLAKYLKVHRSTVNRAINHKYIETPWGDEKYLKFFLTNRKLFIKKILSQFNGDSGNKLTDEKIREIIRGKYNITLARRTICAYRNELNTIKP